jgi:hypothetical protein
MEANCYECEYRGGCAGSASSCCEHPSIEKTSIGEIMGMLGSVGRVPTIIMENYLDIRGNAHGIRSGWFNWPYNFDPVWLENCNGFKKKGESDAQETDSPENGRSNSCNQSSSQSRQVG